MAAIKFHIKTPSTIALWFPCRSYTPRCTKYVPDVKLFPHTTGGCQKLFEVSNVIFCCVPPWWRDWTPMIDIERSLWITCAQNIQTLHPYPSLSILLHPSLSVTHALVPNKANEQLILWNHASCVIMDGWQCTKCHSSQTTKQGHKRTHGCEEARENSSWTRQGPDMSWWALNTNVLQKAFVFSLQCPCGPLRNHIITTSNDTFFL